MPALMIREDLPPGALRRLAKAERDLRVARRLLAIAAALEGLSREAAARVAGMDRQTLRDWVIRYNRGGPAGLSDHWGDGRPCRLTEGQQATLKAIVLQGPDPEADGVSAWRLIDLCQIVQERFGVTYSETGMGKLMRSLDLSWQTLRPRHAETDHAAQERFKKARSAKLTGRLSARVRRGMPQGCDGSGCAGFAPDGAVPACGGDLASFAGQRDRAHVRWVAAAALR
jgi:transposase